MRPSQIRKVIASLGVILSLVTGCSEAHRFEIYDGDRTPPDAPVFVNAIPTSGGAIIRYSISESDANSDLLKIEAAYNNTEGKTVRFVSSFFTNEVEVKGFVTAGEHAVKLCAIDRAGNRSKEVPVTVTSDEAPIAFFARSVQVMPAFHNFLIGWNDSINVRFYVYVDYTFVQDGKKQDYQNVFTTTFTESRISDSIKIAASEQVGVKVRVQDTWGNMLPAKDTTITFYTDQKLSKGMWIFPDTTIVMDGVRQAATEDGDLVNLKDEQTEGTTESNFWQTNDAIPWNIIIDLGEQRELSRIITHQRRTWKSDLSERGAYYRGENVLNYNLYVWNETDGKWEFCSRHDITTPIIRQENEYNLLGDAGDEAFIYPDRPRFSIPTRYLRLEALRGRYMSEITLFGK
jgi:PKD repeat protein